MNEANGSRAELPEGWEWKKIAEIATVVGGSTPKSKEPSYWGGDIPWLGVADLTGYNDMYIGTGARSITQVGYDSCSTQKVPPGTVLFSSRAPIGYVAIAANELCTSQGFKSFVPGESVSSEYLYWWLRYAKPIAESMASGTTFRELSGKRAAEIPVPVPPLEEQHQIVGQVEELMAGVAAARRSLSAAVRNLVSLRRSVVDRSADPDQWELRDLGDLLAVGLMNGRSVPTADDGFPVLRLTALRKGVVDLEQSKTGAWTASEASPYLVRRGDFLVARGNGSLSLVGRGGLVEHQNPPPVAFPDTVIRVQVEDDTIRREYLRLIWDSRLVREQIEQQAHTTAGIYKINQPMLRALRLPVPPIAEQDRLVRQARESLSGLNELETILHRQGAAGGQLERSILRAVLTGKLAAHTSDDSAVQRSSAVSVRGASE